MKSMKISSSQNTTISLFKLVLCNLLCLYKMTVLCSSGKEEGLGVENLRGSGMIAGESSRAYKEVVTINLVCLSGQNICTNMFL